MNLAISKGLRTQKPLPFQGALRHEIAHWLFLENWDTPLRWHEERYLQIKLSPDASQSGWGGVISAPFYQETSDYWSEEEMSLDIATREALAVDKVLHSFKDSAKDSRVDILIDNQAVIAAWNNQGCKSKTLNDALETIFFTTAELNILLRMTYVPTQENQLMRHLADSPLSIICFHPKPGPRYSRSLEALGDIHATSCPLTLM